MFSKLGNQVDAVVRVVAFSGLILFPALIFVCLFEVVARYGFNAPTLWAFDFTFMIHGALFMLTAGYALQKNDHVRIDVLSRRFPKRVQHATNFIAYVFIFLPAIWLVANAGVRRSISAYQTNEVELVSSWGPIVWPFFTALTIGAAALWLQALIEAIRHAVGVVKNE